MNDKRERIADQRVILDEKEYKDKHFDGCELVITGKGPIRMLNCSFGSNHLGFDGPAARAIDSLTGMYAGADVQADSSKPSSIRSKAATAALRSGRSSLELAYFRARRRR